MQTRCAKPKGEYDPWVLLCRVATEVDLAWSLPIGSNADLSLSVKRTHIETDIRKLRCRCFGFSNGSRLSQALNPFRFRDTGFRCTHPLQYLAEDEIVAPDLVEW